MYPSPGFFLSKIFSGILLLVFVHILPVKAQDNSLRFFDFPGKYNSKRFKTVIAVESGLYAASMIELNELWYKNYERSPFHFFNDNEEWLQMDKAGHAVSAYYLGKVGVDALRWSGVGEKKAIFFGGSLGSVFLTTIEILDGFSNQWGFSKGDVLANTFGSLVFIGQELGWKEQRILLKFSFSGSRYAQYRPDLLGNSVPERVLKDYNGQTYWVSANISSFLKQENKFPKWLNIAFGYGADGMLGGGINPLFNDKGISYPSFERYRQYYFSLDVDLTRIKTSSKLLNACFHTFGFIKFPAPALEYNEVEGLKFLPFYF